MVGVTLVLKLRHHRRALTKDAALSGGSLPVADSLRVAIRPLSAREPRSTTDCN